MDFIYFYLSNYFPESPRPLRPKALFLVGPSRLGKTQFVRSLGEHAYVNNLWDLAAFDGKSDAFWHSGYVVFDDLKWSTFEHSAKSFCGAQRDFSVTDKYKRKRRLVGGLPCIVNLNIDEYENEGWKTFAQGSWGMENVVVVLVIHKMWLDVEPFDLNLL